MIDESILEMYRAIRHIETEPETVENYFNKPKRSEFKPYYINEIINNQ